MRKELTPLITVAGGALVLLIIPAVAWVIHWRWNADSQWSFLWLFYLLTQTVTRPYGILTSLIILSALLWALNIARRDVLRVALIVILPVIIGQFAVGQIKQLTQEPRPYVVWLKQREPQLMQRFYQVDRDKRGQLIATALAQDTRIAGWQKQHWQTQTDYAFPSGHTVFAATWALMVAAIMFSRRRVLLPALVMIWAAGVVASRLLLGVHWPGDLVVSLLMAFGLSLPAAYLLVRVNQPTP